MPADAQDAEAAAPPVAHTGLGREMRKLSGQTLVYGIGGVALQLVGVITLPIFARIFSPADYGIIELGTVVAAICMIVVDGGMGSASQRSYFDYGDDDEAQRRRILTTALLFQLALGAVMALALAAFAGPVSRAMLDGREESGMFVLIGATLPAFAAAQFTREILRLEFRAWSYLATSVAGAAVGTAIAILAVVSWDAGIEGPFIGVLAGSVVGALYGLVLVGQRLVARPSRRELSVMLRFGFPLIPAALSLWALSLIDRIMLAHLADLDELGQYAVANRIALPVVLIVTALAVAFSPFILSIFQADPEREKHVRARVLTDFTAVLVLTALATALWARELIDIVAPAFDEAYKSVGIVAFGVVLFGVSGVVVSGISISRQTRWIGLYSTLAAVVNIGLNFVLIPPLGQVGAALATLVAYGVLCAAYYVCAQILYPTPYRPGPVLATLAVGVALMPIGAIAFDDLAIAQLVKVAAMVAFVLALRPIGIVGRGDLRRAIEWVRGRAPREVAP